MSTARDRRIEAVATQLYHQRRWVEEHGGDRAGYVARYGTPHHLVAERQRLSRPCGRHDTKIGGGCFNCGWDGKVHGQGGDAIYDADIAELRRLERELALLEG